MSAAAEPLTPARFDVLTNETGRHPITFMPAADEAATVRIGTLVVVRGVRLAAAGAAILLLSGCSGGDGQRSGAAASAIRPSPSSRRPASPR